MATSPDLPITQLHIPEGMIDLGLGDPQFELLPLERLRRSAEHCFAQQDTRILQYGIEQGNGYFRQALAEFLSPDYGFSVDPAGLLVTNGASMGLDLICTLFTKPGDIVFVEEPSYFLALRVLADHGLRPVAIPVDEQGLVIEVLENELKQNRPALLYTIPTFQNPSGYTLAAERRDRLVALSQEYDFLVAADEVYHLLSYTSRPPSPLAAFCDQKNIISLGSFSKILAPGLRLGWIQGHPAQIGRIAGCGLLDSGGGLNPFTSAIVLEMVASGGLAENIARLRSVYGARVQVMATALQRWLPGVAYSLPQGGFFFWVRLPEGIDAEKLARRAGKYQVNFRAGVRFSSQGALREYLRLCFAFYEAGRIEEGIHRLGMALQEAA